MFTRFELARAAIAAMGLTLSAAAQFAAPVPYPTSPGLRPLDVEFADLNGDTHPDMVTANCNSPDVTVRFGSATGVFGPANTYSVSGGACQTNVAIGDLDRDGDLDLAVALYALGSPGGVQVLRNNGAGVFTALPKMTAGSRPVDVSCCDLDGDDLLDLVVCNFASGICSNFDTDITVFRNLGAMTFSVIGTYPVGCHPKAMTCCDLDNDGDADIAVAADQSHQVNVLFNDGSGGFGTTASFSTGAGTAPWRIECCDMDLDGAPDLVVGTRATNDVRILWGDGSGGFTLSVYPAPKGHAVACGDMNCDGLPDIVTTNIAGPLTDGTFTVLDNGGMRTFPTQTTYPGAAGDPRSLTVGQLDGGGGLDIAIAGTNLSKVSVHLSTVAECCTPPPKNMVLWLPFDAPSTTTAKNATGANDGTLVNGPTHVPAAMVAGARAFDGINDYVDVPHYADIGVGQGHFSIDAWVRRDSASSAVQTIVDKRDGTRGYSLYLYQGSPGLQLADGSGFTNFNTSIPDTVPVDGEYHLVAVSVRRGQSNGIRFYVDGVLVETADPTVRPGSLANTVPLRVGARSGSPSGYFRGVVDELEVFARSLRAQEIRTLYNARRDGKCKVFCQVPWDSPFCLNQSSISVNHRICNASSSPQTVTYSFAGLPANAQCSIAGPTSFTPASGTVVVPPCSCVTVTTTIGRPAGMTAAYLVGCYEMIIQWGGRTKRCRGSVQDRRDLCTSFTVDYAVATGRSALRLPPIAVTNTSGRDTTLDYTLRVYGRHMQLDRQAVRINGRQAGPVKGRVMIANGRSVSIPLSLQFAEPRPFEVFSLVMYDGADRPMASMDFQNQIEASGSTSPTGFAAREGNTAISTLFGRTDRRFQQIDNTQGRGQRIVRALAWRRDGTEASGRARGPIGAEVSVAMGQARWTTIQGGNLDRNYIAGSKTTVFRSRRVNFPDWSRTAGSPGPFDLVLPLDRPWRHNGTDALVWDVISQRWTQPVSIVVDGENRSVARSVGRSLGAGCTVRGMPSPFAGSMSVSNYGPSNPQFGYRIENAARFAPRNTAVFALLSPRDINVRLPGLCTAIRPDPTLQLTLGVSDASGRLGPVNLDLPYQQSFEGLPLVVQYGALDAAQSGLPIALSNGVAARFPAAPQRLDCAYVVAPATGNSGLLQRSQGAIAQLRN